jgi:hypothetical protein
MAAHPKGWGDAWFGTSRDNAGLDQCTPSNRENKIFSLDSRGWMYNSSEVMETPGRSDLWQISCSFHVFLRISGGA